MGGVSAQVLAPFEPGLRIAMAAPPDRETALVRRAVAGDVDAFEAVYRSHVGRIYAVCLRMVADPAEAEELTQEAFVRAWSKLGSYRGGSAFGTWLHRLAVNVVLDSLRARRRWRERFADGPTESGLGARAGDPTSAVDLEAAIARLPPRARVVFVLYDIEGYRHREIARMTGLSAGTCKAHLHRARQRLREILDR